MVKVSGCVALGLLTGVVGKMKLKASRRTMLFDESAT
jgi:hypothetical protein